MADLSGTILSLAGWLVAGVVTLIGILVTSWFRDWKQECERDLADIYEPTYKIIRENLDSEIFKLHEPEVPSSWNLYYDLRGLLKSGRLIPRRFEDLKADLEKLSQLSENADKKERALTEQIRDKLKNEVDLLKMDNSIAGFLNQTLFFELENDLLFPLLKSKRKKHGTSRYCSRC